MNYDAALSRVAWGSPPPLDIFVPLTCSFFIVPYNMSLINFPIHPPTLQIKLQISHCCFYHAAVFGDGGLFLYTNTGIIHRK